MNQDQDAVGVVVPMYNAERTIGSTLQSVSAQPHKNLEPGVAGLGKDLPCLPRIDVQGGWSVDAFAKTLSRELAGAGS